MQIPLQVTLRHMERTDALVARIRDMVDKLEQVCDEIISCRVLVEASSARHQTGQTYHVRINLSLRRREVVVSRDQAQNHAHEDAYVALRDAFNAAHRQLEELVDRKQHRVKAHTIKRNSDQR